MQFTYLWPQFYIEVAKNKSTHVPRKVIPNNEIPMGKK